MSKLQTLAKLAQTGRLSRRQFMQAAGLAGAAAAVPSVFTTAHAAPKRGGKLTAGIAHGSTTDTYDPGSWTDDFMYATGPTRYSYLTEIDADGNLIGDVAESFEAKPGAKTWIFKLRRGVEFQNGKTLTAEDVIASINHHRGEDSTSAVKPYVDPIVDMKADGDSVIITLTDGNADFPYAMVDMHLPMMPAKDGKADWQSGIGTGPYQVTEFEPGVRFRAKRNPNYWKAGRGHFDEVELICIPDVAARTNALTTGQIDFMDRCEIKTLHLLERNRNATVLETEGAAHYSIPMRTNLSPFDDNNIRLALKYAIDRKALLQTVLRGHGAIGNDQPIGRSYRYYDPSLPQKSYDPDKAKFYLKKAGQPNLKVDLSAADAAFAGAVDAAVLVKEHAAKAGIDITVVREPNDGYWENVWNTDNRGWCMCYWSGRPTEDQMFATAYADGAPWNDSNWKNPRFNQLLTAARSELNDGKRRTMYAEMQRLVSDDGGVVVPLFNNYIIAVGKKVGHEKLAANLPNDGHRFAERWWFS